VSNNCDICAVSTGLGLRIQSRTKSGLFSHCISLKLSSLKHFNCSITKRLLSSFL